MGTATPKPNISVPKAKYPAHFGAPNQYASGIGSTTRAVKVATLYGRGMTTRTRALRGNTAPSHVTPTTGVIATMMAAMTARAQRWPADERPREAASTSQTWTGTMRTVATPAGTIWALVGEWTTTR